MEAKKRSAVGHTKVAQSSFTYLSLRCARIRQNKYKIEEINSATVNISTLNVTAGDALPPSWDDRDESILCPPGVSMASAERTVAWLLA